MNSQDIRSTEQRDETPMYFGRVMSPTEVVGALTSYSDEVRQRVAGHWMFCGDVAAPLFERIQNERDGRIPFRITGFKSSLGGAYAVLTHQLAGHQHRFLLPLYEPRVVKCIAGLDAGLLGFMFGNNEGDDAVVLTGYAPNVEFRPLLALQGPARDPDLRDMLVELPMAIATMASSTWIPSLVSAERVLAVSVSVVIPDAALDTIRRDFAMESR